MARHDCTIPARSTLTLGVAQPSLGLEDRTGWSAPRTTSPASHDRCDQDLFLRAHREPLAEVVLDVDATDDPVHGHQLGRFFHGYYKSYCYLPLSIFCGDHLLCARLRPSDIDASAGASKQLQRVVAQIRQAWPAVEYDTTFDDDDFVLPVLTEEILAKLFANMIEHWIAA